MRPHPTPRFQVPAGDAPYGLAPGRLKQTQNIGRNDGGREQQPDKIKKETKWHQKLNKEKKSFEITSLIAFHEASWDFLANLQAEALPILFLLSLQQISPELLIFLVSLGLKLGGS